MLLRCEGRSCGKSWSNDLATKRPFGGQINLRRPTCHLDSFLHSPRGRLTSTVEPSCYLTCQLSSPNCRFRRRQPQQLSCCR